MKTVQILFVPEVMKAIRMAVADRAAQGDEYRLPENFDYVGQTFENAVCAYADNGFFMVEVQDRKDENKTAEYFYPAHSISRVKVVE